MTTQRRNASGFHASGARTHNNNLLRRFGGQQLIALGHLFGVGALGHGAHAAIFLAAGGELRRAAVGVTMHAARAGGNLVATTLFKFVGKLGSTVSGRVIMR